MKRYKDYFNNINLTKEEKIKMKENIMKEDKNKKKFIFKLASIPTIFICVLLIGGAIAVTANSIIRQFKVQEGNRVVMENEKLDIDIDEDILNKTTYYTHESLENLFGIKILKNSKLDNYFFKIGDYSLKTNNGKLSRVYFENVNKDGKEIINNIEIGFSLKTKYYEEEDKASWISGPTKVDYYYIKALDTEAVILETEGDSGPIFADFVYDNVVYSLVADKWFYNVENIMEDIYTILDSYIKP